MQIAWFVPVGFLVMAGVSSQTHSGQPSHHTAPLGEPNAVLEEWERVAPELEGYLTNNRLMNECMFRTGTLLSATEADWQQKARTACAFAYPEAAS